MSKVRTLFLTTAFVIAVSSSTASDVTLLTVPMSSVVVIGDEVELNCSINENYTLTWMFTSWNTSNETIIYLGRGIVDSYKSRYSIDNRISGQHNLIINSADMAHAGRYLCRAISTSPIEAAAQLTVLGTFPKCWTNTSNADHGVMEHGYLWMWCRVTYTGNMIPIFAWTKNNEKTPIAENTTTSDTHTPPLIITSSVIAQLNADDNGAVFKCKITFQLPNNAEGNAPEYKYMWNYTANVLYGPRNISIIRYGDRLECSADGNPTPAYRWTHAKTIRSMEGPTFMLHDITESDKAYTFQCTAVNAIATTNKNITDGESSNEIARSSSIQMRPSPFGLQSELPTVIENQDSHTTATTVDYCALTDRPSTKQDPQLYCELRLYEQPSKVYTNQPTPD